MMMAIAFIGTAGFTACTSDDDENLVYDDNGTAGVKSEFVISIPRSVVGVTRMSEDLTQSAGTYAQFRGIDNVRLIPFEAEPTASSSKLSDIIKLGPIGTLVKAGTLNYKIYEEQFVPVKTKYFLFYGKAVDNSTEEAITTMDDKFKYGFLQTKGLTDEEFKTTDDIVFSPQQINENAGAQAGDATGQRIVTLLNELANIEAEGATVPNDKWSTTTNFVLARLYQNFTKLSTASSSTLSTVLGKLHFAMDHVLATDPARKLANAIKAKIETACTSAPTEGNPASLKNDYLGYPTNLGLPEGAARIRWNGTGLDANSFTDVSANFGRNFLMKNTDYVYPAALWYYVNTPLKASSVKKSGEYDAEATWNNVINNVYSGAADEVGGSTQSVALKKAVEYGVGRIETRIFMDSGTFYDANGKVVNIGSGYTLKGVLIGGQNSVKYDFTPKGSEKKVIYDREMNSSSIVATTNYTTTANHTLALETRSNEVIHAALELINGGDDFMGFDGIIPHGGTFYLAVKLDPRKAVNYDKDTMNKIVLQDHVTKVTVTIKNGATTVDRNGDDADGDGVPDGDGHPDKYVKDADGKPIGVDADGDGKVDPYDIDGDGEIDAFITDPERGGPGWDTDGDGIVDLPIPVDPETGEYPDTPLVPDGLGGATNGVPDLTSPGIELGTSVNLEWQQGLILNPNI